MASAYHDLTDEIAIMGNVVWQQWSQFGEPSLEVSAATSRKATADLDYDDTWGVRARRPVQVCPGLAVVAGVRL